eukprot:1561130-Pyramimonas_sp.AAC.1
MLDIRLGDLDTWRQASGSRHPQQILMLDICLGNRAGEGAGAGAGAGAGGGGGGKRGGGGGAEAGGGAEGGKGT